MSTQNIGFIDPSEWSEVLQYPLAQPPEGIASNFDNPKYFGQPVIAVSAICVPVLLAALITRVYAKARVVKKLLHDDYLYFIVSWPAGFAFICLSLAIVTTGAYGHHAWDVRIGDLSKAIIIRSLTLSTVAGLICWLIRLSLFTLIEQLFAPYRWVRVLVYAGVVISGVIYLIPCITFIVLCRPRGGTSQVAYIAGMASEQCSDTKGIGIKTQVLTGVLNVVVDFYMFLLPLPIIRKLQISKRRMKGIYFVFSAALLGCLTDIIVLYFRIHLLGNQDVTYVVIPIFAVSIVETTVALLIPCAASFVAVWRHFRDDDGSAAAEEDRIPLSLCVAQTTKPKQRKDSALDVELDRSFSAEDVTREPEFITVTYGKTVA